VSTSARCIFLGRQTSSTPNGESDLFQRLEPRRFAVLTPIQVVRAFLLKSSDVKDH
jgi:hypothetical protein